MFVTFQVLQSHVMYRQKHKSQTTSAGAAILLVTTHQCPHNLGIAIKNVTPQTHRYSYNL